MFEIFEINAFKFNEIFEIIKIIIFVINTIIKNTTIILLKLYFI